MLKDFLWETFEITGNVNTYVFYKEVEEKNKLLKERLTAREEFATSNN